MQASAGHDAAAGPGTASECDMVLLTKQNCGVREMITYQSAIKALRHFCSVRLLRMVANILKRTLMLRRGHPKMDSARQFRIRFANGLLLAAIVAVVPNCLPAGSIFLFQRNAVASVPVQARKECGTERFCNRL
uniref:Uncharacterized protein n=1 Tax=Anopheles culicifacies TaxID=139723 RepID=A0A182MLY7_9DIPT